MHTKSEPSKMLIIRVLESCNAGCFMCKFASNNDEYYFSLQEALSVAKATKNLSVTHVRLSGGEPLLISDIAAIISVFKSKVMYVSIITNGWELPLKLNKIADAGIDQIIISLDGATPDSHDKFRRLDGLFSRCIAGIEKIRKDNTNIIIRVNTIVGTHNIDELPKIYQLLIKLEVDQWSIIPLKHDRDLWHNKEELLRLKYKAFCEMIAISEKPKLLGYSNSWAGRNEAEISLFCKENKPFTPKKKCQLVEQVIYFIPKNGMLFPCNCVPHRNGKQKLFSTVENFDFEKTDIEGISQWLKFNGPDYCRGCEPINAALGEGIINIEDDPFGF